jgi:hypothetical protein
MPSTPDFTLAGFSQEGSIRHFSFRCVNVDRSHSDFMVDADTDLIRSYGISLQDLPLLCRRLLEETVSLTSGDVVIFSEDLMRQHSDRCEAAARIAEQKKQARNKPNHDHLGQGRRGPSL